MPGAKSSVRARCITMDTRAAFGTARICWRKPCAIPSTPRSWRRKRAFIRCMWVCRANISRSVWRKRKLRSIPRMSGWGTIRSTPCRTRRRISCAWLTYRRRSFIARQHGFLWTAASTQCPFSAFVASACARRFPLFWPTRPLWRIFANC